MRRLRSLILLIPFLAATVAGIPRSYGVPATAAAPSAQKPEWPQPVMRGTVILFHPGSVPTALWERFIEASGADGAEVLVVEEQPTSSLPGEYPGLKTPPVKMTIDEVAKKGVEGFRGVWIQTPHTVSAEALQGLKPHLQRLLGRNGTVAGPETLAASFYDGQEKPGIGLLEGVVALTEGSTGGAPLDKLLTRPAPRFALSFPARTALVERKRRVTVIGDGIAHAILPAGSGRPREEVEIGRTAPADFIALRRRAIERALPPFPAVKQPVPNVKSGALVIVGGGGMPMGLAERFVELAGGPDAPIVYVPCEEDEELPEQTRELEMFRRAGARNVTWIHTKDRTRASTDEKILGPLRTAKGVWFGGGRQWNLADSYLDTEAQELMKKVLERGGVIGGSSAGASIQSEYMARGNPLGNLDIMAPGYERGLGFIRGVAIDQHFTARGRHKDMTQLIKAYPQLLGIGLDEATAIIVRGSMAEVTGRGSVFFFDAKRPHKEGEPDYETAPSGSSYDLAQRKLMLKSQ